MLFFVIRFPASFTSEFTVRFLHWAVEPVFAAIVKAEAALRVMSSPAVRITLPLKVFVPESERLPLVLMVVVLFTESAAEIVPSASSMKVR